MKILERLVHNGKDVARKDAKEKILDIAIQTWEEIECIIDEKYPNFNKNFRLKLSPRLRTTGGTARIERNGYLEVTLNERLLSENLDQVRMVVIHEVAHLIQYTVFKGQSRGHDNVFKGIMRSLGCSPTVTHTMDASKLKKKVKTVHYYSCACGLPHEISPQKHARIQRGVGYRCRRSRELLIKECHLGSFQLTRAKVGTGWNYPNIKEIMNLVHGNKEN